MKGKKELISDDWTTENNHTYSVKSIFLLNAWQKLETGDFVLMVILVSFDLTVSRGLSWSTNNGPDLSSPHLHSVVVSIFNDTRHQRPFMAILNRAFFSPARSVFLPQTMAKMALMITVPHCQTLYVCLCFLLFNVPLIDFTVILLLRLDYIHLRGGGGGVKSLFCRVAVILNGWPHQLHTGLYWVK